MAADYFTQVQGSGGWTGILESFARFVAPQPGQRVLDVGCGPGALARIMARHGCQVVGVDANPAMVARAEELAEALPAAEFRLGSVLALPFDGPEFDVITATNVIFLLSDPLAGLREMARVCRPGGRVAMLNPSPRLSHASAQAHAEALGLKEFDAFTLTNWGSIAEKHRRFDQAELEALFGAAGLQPEAFAEKIGPGLALLASGRKPGP